MNQAGTTALAAGWRVVIARACWNGVQLAGLLWIVGSLHCSGSPALSDPEVDRFNVRVGTQTFSPRYKFTGETSLVETAGAIRGMGSDILKLYLGRNTRGQYGITPPPNVSSLKSLAESEPSYRRVLDMPFLHYLVWTYTFASKSDAWWKDGLNPQEQAAEYQEIYAFAQYLLTNYNHSGKSFYVGHWEGDWHLLTGYNTRSNPSPVSVQGMIDWLNTRQRAVDDASRDTKHTNVFVYHYTEVNRVRDAMVNGSTNNQRAVNAVLPWVTNLDYVSWSAYDGMSLGRAELHATLDYIESNLSRNKAGRIPGKRVIIGEYGWGGSLSSERQERPTRQFMGAALAWGAPFVLFWQIYDNENRAYWLIDSNNVKTACYDLHQRCINRARLAIGRFKETRGRLPDDAEFSAMAADLLEHPLPAPVALAISHAESTAGAGSVVVRARLEQGIYGDEPAQVRVFFGQSDGGTNEAAWSASALVGTNHCFNATTFSHVLNNHDASSGWFFRFQASNTGAVAWAPGAGRVVLEHCVPAER